MTVNNTKNLSNDKINILVYGNAGIGKTCLIPSLPRPIVLNAEGGLLSIMGADIPYINIRSMKDLDDAFDYLTKPDVMNTYDSICLDSISEIAEICLNEEMEKTKDGRMAYGQMGKLIEYIIRTFRDFQGKIVYFTAKLDKVKDEVTGRIMWGPSMPGNVVSKDLPYQFDEVFAMRAETEAKTGAVRRFLQTSSSDNYIAKDRSGALNQFEEADLGAIIQKIGGMNAQ